MFGDKTKKTVHKKKVQPKLRSQKNRQLKARMAKSVKAHASKVIFSNAKSALKSAKEAAIKHSEHAAFRSHAIRAHEAIRNFGKSLSEKHHAIRSKILCHAANIFPKKQPVMKTSFAPHNHVHTNTHKRSAAPQKNVMLLNMTKNHLISNKVVFANTTYQKFRGLMFKNKKEVDYALVFDFDRASKDSAAIHMFFVFFPIDVVYLRDSHVVDLHRAVKPFTAYLAPKKHADTLIELPQGTIWSSGISIGDEIVTTSG